MKNRKADMAVGALQLLAASMIVSLAVFSIHGAIAMITEVVEERNHYRGLYQLEEQTTQVLMQNTLDRIRDNVSYGTDVINVEIPCTVDQGVVHQVMYRVVR